MAANDFLPLFSLSRGGHPESLHFGAIAVVDAAGNLLASLGNVEQFLFPRSSAKPFQAMPLLEAGAIAQFNLSDEDIALICASHSGTDAHLDALMRLQTKIGFDENDLLCGTHVPYHRQTAQRMLKNGEVNSSLRHNCSGKHSGMLALAKLKGWATSDYVNPNHPVQLVVKESFSVWTGLPSEHMAVGIDGCSAPNFAVPLSASARAFAHLMDPSDMPKWKAEAAGHIRRAMTGHPEMVAGPERFDSALMAASQGRLLAKEGAEGFQGIGVPRGAVGKDSPALGIAIKIADGDARGLACSSVAIEVLRQLGVLDQEQIRALSSYGPVHDIRNQGNLLVGEARADFELERH